MPVKRCNEKGDFCMAIIQVKDVTTLVAVGAWLLVTLSACEHSKHAETMSVEDIRAQTQQSADPDDDRSGVRSGAIAEKEIARAEEPASEPEVARRLEPHVLVPKTPRHLQQRDDPMATRVKRAKESALADVFFDFNKYTIRSEAVHVLEKNAELLKHTYKHSSVLLEGHCDERGTVQYNLELGKRRAQAVKKYLIDLGVEASRIRIVSYGKEKPFCKGSTPRCRQQNRRVHFVW